MLARRKNAASPTGGSLLHSCCAVSNGVVFGSEWDLSARSRGDVQLQRRQVRGHISVLDGAISSFQAGSWGSSWKRRRAGRSIRETLERDRTAAQVRQQHGRDRRAILDGLALGEPAGGIEDLAEVREAQAMLADDDRGAAR